MPDNPDENRNAHPPAPPGFPRGTAISHYTIVLILGVSGMGDVYLAEDTALHRRVALKFLPIQYDRDERVRTRFLREARAAALNHPNVVTIHEVDEHEGRPFIAMQYVRGHSLKHAILHEAMPIERIIEISIAIGTGLREAHRAGIVHRDIKPANIMIGRGGRPVILDFGLARIEGAEGLTRSGAPLGTAGYMSPEQARGQSIDLRSDIFSFGVVLYEWVTGHAPFKRESVFETLQAIIREEPEPIGRFRGDAPEELQRILSRALAKEREDRYPTCDELIEDLRLFRNGRDPAHAPPDGPVERPRRATSLAVLYLRNLGAARASTSVTGSPKT